MAKSKKEELEVVEQEKSTPTQAKDVKVTPPPVKKESNKKVESALYYFYSVGCGFCKKAEPIVDELNKEGHNILKLDLAEKDNQGLKNELSQKYNKQCGTPWFIDGNTGNQVCGFREKSDILKWVNGEDIPAPPRPTGPPPKLPFHNAPKAEISKWKEDYKKWTTENEHLPNIQKAEDILARPRPKSDPPKPPIPGSDDKVYKQWGDQYDKWKTENDHLPNLQPANVIMERLKQRATPTSQPVTPGPGQGNQLSAEQNARITRLEQKLDKLIKHLGVK